MLAVAVSQRSPCLSEVVMVGKHRQTEGHLILILFYRDTDVAVAAAVLALKSLHQHHASITGTLNVVASLASNFDNITHPEARACILWMVGQYARASGQGTTPMPESLQAIEPWVPDILRKAAKSFTSDVRYSSPGRSINRFTHKRLWSAIHCQAPSFNSCRKGLCPCSKS